MKHSALSRRNDLIWQESVYSQHTIREISNIFNVSIRTVKKHISTEEKTRRKKHDIFEQLEREGHYER